jgi:hypothetical protein
MTMFFRSLLQRLAPSAGSRQQARTKLAARSCNLAVENLEDRCVPAASISIGDVTIVEGNSGTQVAAVQVTVSQPHGNNVTVNFNTVNGSATAGSDFTAVSGKLTFAKNEMSKVIQIPIRGDRVAESAESFVVQLSNAKSAQIAKSQGSVSIVDNEPRASITSPSVVEGAVGGSVLTFNVSLEQGYDLPVTINYATAADTATVGDDFVAASGSVTFLPGQTQQPIAVTVNDDRLFESSETIFVNLTTTNTSVVITNAQGVGTIIDNEPRLYIDSTTQGYYDSIMTFYVYLAVPYDEVVTVDFTTWDGSALAYLDYVPNFGTLTFNPGETVQTITVDLLNFEPTGLSLQRLSQRDDRDL